MLLFETLVIAIVGLVPGQSRRLLGLELLVFGTFWWLFATGVFTVRRPVMKEPFPIVVNIVGAQLATLPVVVAGIAELAGAGEDSSGSFPPSCSSWVSES